MRREITASVVAVIAFTVLFGLAYPLITTGAAQLIFGDEADGSRIERDGVTVGSELIGQEFTKKVPRGSEDANRRFKPVPDERYFQPRPSVTGYSADVTFFNNLGPNNRELSEYFEKQINAYLELEGQYTPGLERPDVPVDAVTTSASGVDPHISEANAEIQANRIAEERGLEVDRVLELIDEHTDGRALGFLGEPGVNVLKLNLALDEEEGSV
jgi:potassium-transporting ATPase KdpC subunit